MKKTRFTMSIGPLVLLGCYVLLLEALYDRDWARVLVRALVTALVVATIPTDGHIERDTGEEEP